MDIAQQQFETENRLVTLLDAPGHRDFIPNMITGAAQVCMYIHVPCILLSQAVSGFTPKNEESGLICTWKFSLDLTVFCIQVCTY